MNSTMHPVDFLYTRQELEALFRYANEHDVERGGRYDARQACTSAHAAPRQLTVRPQAHHEAIQAARQRQETTAFKAQYALRAGVESSLSQGIRRFDLRQSRYRGLARTHLQQLLNATAMHVVRVIAWLRGEPLGERRRQPGHFARLAPHPLSRQTVLCSGRRQGFGSHTHGPLHRLRPPSVHPSGLPRGYGTVGYEPRPSTPTASGPLPYE